MTTKKKVLATCVLGNALEFYDFTLYGVFAVIISQLYFPSSDPLVSVLASWGAFAAGFVMRPFGAAVFGYVGDKFGRKRALSLSILGMGIPTLLIGVLPTYASIGVVAPIALILFRLIQGLCTGGEYNGAAIFALEHVGKNKPGFTGGLITGSCVIGAMLATGLGALVMKSGDPEYFWRFTFVFGGAISFIGTYLRRRVAESPEYEEASQIPVASKSDTAIPVNSFVVCFLIGCLNGALSYTLFGFLNSYLKSYIGVSMVNAMTLNIIGLCCFMISAPVTGLIMDRFGKSFYFPMACLFVIGAVSSAFFLIQGGSLGLIITAQILLGIATGCIAGPQHGFVQTLFPVKSRYKGISISFCAGMAICGGTAPMILTFLIEKTSNLYMPAFYISVLASLLFIAVMLSRKKIKNHQLSLTKPW